MDVTAPDGLRLDVDVRERGPGVPLLFLHGVASSRQTYDWLPPDVTDGHRDIRVDFRGHGASGREPGTYDRRHYYDDTVAVIEAVGGPVVVVGFSLGGTVAWQLAQHRPDLVTAALLEDPPLFFEDVYDAGDVPRALRSTIEQEEGWRARGVEVDEAARELAENPAGPGRTWGDLHRPDAIRVLAAATLVRDRGVVEAAIDATMTAGLDRDAPVRVPVTVVGGDPEFGAVFGPDHADRLRRQHPDVRCHHVPGAAHAVHSTWAGRDAYLGHLRSFLARYAAPGEPGRV